MIFHNDKPPRHPGWDVLIAFIPAAMAAAATITAAYLQYRPLEEEKKTDEPVQDSKVSNSK